ncbi:MAG: hypothetical protein RL196_332 [Actinomycetota bacterium]|jgi:hypothetical protein
MTIFMLCLLSASGYPVGWTLIKLVSAEEAMVASGKGRDWKVLLRFLFVVLLSASVTFGLMLLVGLDESVTTDQIVIFGIATLVLMARPILRYRWLQMQKKNSNDC